MVSEDVYESLIVRRWGRFYGGEEVEFSVG